MYSRTIIFFLTSLPRHCAHTQLGYFLPSFFSGERPRVSISGSNNGASIIIGESVTFTCVVTGGVPDPQISWAPDLPSNAVTTANGNAIVVTLTNVLESTCVTCVGSSLAGEGRDTECVDVRGRRATEY